MYIINILVVNKFDFIYFVIFYDFVKHVLKYLPKCSIVNEYFLLENASGSQSLIQ